MHHNQANACTLILYPYSFALFSFVLTMAASSLSWQVTDKRLSWISFFRKKFASGLVFPTLLKRVCISCTWKVIDEQILMHFSGTFRWAGSHQVAGYTNWARSDGSSEDTPEPNGGTAENCVYKSLSYPPGWSDYRCDATEADGMPCFALCRHGDLPQPPTPTPANTGMLCYSWNQCQVNNVSFWVNL